jgi:hypothetical protein
LLYCTVLGLSFIAFFWICDLGFRHSILTTVNSASRTNLETVARLLAASAPQGDASVSSELRDLSNLWANGALLEVADVGGKWLFRSPQFLSANPELAPAKSNELSFFTSNLDLNQYRVALQKVQAGGRVFEIHAAVPTEPFDQALDRFRIIEKEALPLLVLLASLLGYWLGGKSLQPVNRIQIQVVRRLIQQQSLRMTEQRLRQQHADFLSAL